MKSGPIIIVDDDADDVSILEEIFAELEVKNRIKWFGSGPEAYAYLLSTQDQPFLIISDVNLSGQNGIDFKKDIDSNPILRKKSIPFIFYSTYVDQKVVTTAYTEMTVQGFFKKKNSFSEVKDDMRRIIDYWKNCKHPNSM